MTVLGGDYALTESELATALLSEAESGPAQQTPVAGEGVVVREDGTIRTSIIRPCISRGARIRNLRVIYTPKMLRENAGVFTGWPMFRDHAIVVSEEMREAIEAEADDRQEMIEAICESWMATEARLVEAVKKIGRSVDDLAGRITRSWWDPAVVFEDDAEYGYGVGSVVGLSLLLPSVREVVNSDPGVMHVSINAYPTAGRPGVAADGKTKGMAIEGIRRVPMGSVDTVVRGGAGGRFMRSAVEKPAAAVTEREVSPVQTAYRPAQMPEVNLTPATSEDQLRAYLAEHAPHLAGALRESSTSAAPPAAVPAAANAATGTLTQADIDSALTRAQESFRTTLQQDRDALREELRGESAVSTAATVYEREAHRLIEAATKGSAEGGFLPPKWAADLKARYSIRPTGPAPALLVEAEVTNDVVTKSAMDVLREQVTTDVNYARDLIAEAAGQPFVAGQGGGSAAERERNGDTTGTKTGGRSWLSELDSMGMIEHDDKGQPVTAGLFESMVS